MVYYESNELYHHGILGQKWGVRRYQNPDGTYTEAGKKRRAPLRTRLDAKKDAKEYARAKMYYGEGAGTRRKLIKAKVNQRSKDSAYKEEFDRCLAKQDMAKHAAKARTERGARDAVKGVKKTGRGLVNAAVGNYAFAPASAIAIYGIAHYTGMDKKIMDWGMNAIKNVPQVKVDLGKQFMDAKLRYGAFR